MNYRVTCISALVCLIAGSSVVAQRPELKVTTLGFDTPPWSGTVSAEGSYSGNVFSLTAAGHDFYWCWDRGGFAYVQVSGDFSFSGRLKKAPDVASKAGINVREKLHTECRGIDLRYDYNHSPAEWTWFARLTEGALGNSSTQEKSSCQFIEGAAAGLTEKSGVYAKVERIGGYYTLSLKIPGGNWQEVKSGLRLATDTVYVGLSLASGSRGEFPATAEWDELLLTSKQASSVRTVASFAAPIQTQLKTAVTSAGIVISSRAESEGKRVPCYDVRGRRMAEVRSLLEVNSGAR